MTPERPRHRREAFPSTAGERELREVVKQLEHAQRLEARLTLRRNRLFAKAIEGGRSVTEAAAACGVSRLTAYRILDRVKANTPPPRLTAASNGHEMVADEATV